MAKSLSPTARINKARQLIEKARTLPVPESAGWDYFSYVAQVKEELRKAFELVKLISYSPSTPDEVKVEARKVLIEIEQAKHEILKQPKNTEDE